MGPVVDAETGFQYLRARYYDPATGQFLTRDPIEGMTREAYAYAGNSPLNNIDPSGLNWLSDRASDVGHLVTKGAQAAWDHRQGLLQLGALGTCGVAAFGSGGVAAAACVPLLVTDSTNVVITGAYNNITACDPDWSGYFLDAIPSVLLTAGGSLEVAMSRISAAR